MNLLRYMLPSALFLSSMVFTGCKDSPILEVIPVVTEPVNRVVENEDMTCSSDWDAYYSCAYENSFTIAGAEVVKDHVELSFACIDGFPSLVSPADRVLFSLGVYNDALYSTFMNTDITQQQFDTLTTDYLFQGFTAGAYYTPVNPTMNCIFFQSNNGNFGLIHINSIVGTGTNGSPFYVSFSVKYVDKE